MSLNQTSMQHPTFQANFLRALTLANKQGLEHIRNRNGDAFLRVQKVTKRDGKNAFLVTDKQGNNVVTMLSHAFVFDRPFNALKNLICARIAFNYELSD